METLINVYLQSFLMAFAFTQIFNSGPYQEVVKFLKLRKPFSCIECTAFWSALILNLSYWDHSIVISILGAGVASFLSNQIDRVPKI